MKRMIPLVCLMAAATGCTALNKMKVGMAENPFANDPQSVERGRTIYTAQCASCHGLEGKGDGEDGNYLTTKPTDLQLIAREKSINAVAMNIAYGKNDDMQAFLGPLTMDQVWDVSNYVMTLAGE